MTKYQVGYDHGDSKWKVTKNSLSNVVSTHRKKSTATDRAKKEAKQNAKQNGYTTVEVRTTSGMFDESFEFGNRPDVGMGGGGSGGPDIPGL